jgi:putative nucleotidyltransferase with HDIG domain
MRMVWRQTEKYRDWREARDQALSVSLAETISALSFALDLTEDAVPGHALRTCLIGMRIAAALRLSAEECSSLYYALLLKDVGCSSNAARMCQIIGGGDDRAVKAGAKLEDWTRPHQPKLSGLQLLWQHAAPGASPLGKAWQILKIGATQHENNAEMIGLRCDRGASILRKIGLGAEAAETVRHLDEHWDGRGYPLGLRGNAIPLLSRIACAAQLLDAFAAEKGPDAAISKLIERSGRWFDPEIVIVSSALHQSGGLWRDCWSDGSVRTLEAVLDLAPGVAGHLTPSGIDLICEAFADVVDAKSPFTFRHSTGVSRIAREMAHSMGFDAQRSQFIYRAGLLHDLGKLRVPNSILDKNGDPSRDEWTVIREHPALTSQILGRMRSFSELAAVAGAHHEKLDGSGYPNRLPAAAISTEARILAVADAYSALTEDRPYRTGSSPEEAFALLKKSVPRKLDEEGFEALMASRDKPVREPSTGLLVGIEHLAIGS